MECLSTLTWEHVREEAELEYQNSVITCYNTLLKAIATCDAEAFHDIANGGVVKLDISAYRQKYSQKKMSFVTNLLATRFTVTHGQYDILSISKLE